MSILADGNSRNRVAMPGIAPWHGATEETAETFEDRTMKLIKTELEYAREAWQQAVAGSYPAELIAIAYRDLRACEKKAAKKSTK